MRDLNHDFKELCRHNRDGSYATQADRAHILDLVANQLHEMGVRGLARPGLQAPARADARRALARREARPGDDQEPDEPAALAGAEDRQGQHRRAHQRRLRHPGSGLRHQHLQSKGSLAGNSSRASAPPVPGCRCACRLPSACAGKPRSRSSRRGPIGATRWCSRTSWNKGGREIRIPIRTPEQRQLLDEAKALAKGKSLVAPGYATYRDYLQHFRYECGRVGIHAFHGHRHLYAQERYQELTGWQCPARGGPTSKQLTPTAEGDRSRGARDHQPRDGPRPRADYRGVLGTLTLDHNTRPTVSRHEYARSASCGCLPAHPSGDAAGEGSRRRDSRREDRQMLGIRRC